MVPYMEFYLTKNIKFLRSNINLGFGGVNMLGVQFSKGKYLAFSNNEILGKTVNVDIEKGIPLSFNVINNYLDE